MASVDLVFEFPPKSTDLVFGDTGGEITESNVKIWNGSTWVTGEVKIWNGSTWVVASVKTWNGSAWVT